MNPQIRVLLWVGLGFLLYLNAQAWMKHYSPVVQETPAATAATPRPPRTRRTAWPRSCRKFPEMRRAGRRLTATPVPDSLAGHIRRRRARSASARTCSTWTRASPARELMRADILQYPKHKDDPNTPVRLFNTDSPDTQFLFQSGLTTGEPGRSEPNHKAIFTSAAADYRLAGRHRRARGALHLVGRRRPHGDENLRLSSRLIPRGPALPGHERGRAPVKLASYAQFLRHSLGNERSMWDPETYAFRGPGVFRRQGLPEARYRGRRRRRRCRCQSPTAGSRRCSITSSRRSCRRRSRPTNMSCASRTWTTCCAPSGPRTPCRRAAARSLRRRCSSGRSCRSS